MRNRHLADGVCTGTSIPKAQSLYDNNTMRQENNIQWLDLSNLQMDPSWTYTLAGLGVKLAYQVSTSWTISHLCSSLRRWDFVCILAIYPGHIVLNIQRPS
jgi:hypothetical protein